MPRPRAANPRLTAQRVEIGRILHGPRVQPKLTVGAPDDAYEREADRVADAVMRMPEPEITDKTPVLESHRQASIQRMCPECEGELRRQPVEEPEEEEQTLRRQAIVGEEPEELRRQPVETPEEEDETLRAKAAPGRTPAVTPGLETRVKALRGGGRPLPDATRTFFEPRFGHDFSKVRVHADSAGAEAARAVNARAFTLGRDIAFGPGQYAPTTSAGRRLLAHELTHTVQQGATRQQGMSPRKPGLAAAGVNAVHQVNQPMLMRSLLFSSTMRICHRLLKSRVFPVSQGSLTVVADADWSSSPDPHCGRNRYPITLTKKNLIFDDEYGTCEFETNRADAHSWTGLSKGDYYLTIWPNNTNPYCCLTGNIQVAEQSGVSGPTCTKRSDSGLELLHVALDGAGMFPALGLIPDAINAGIYVIEGDWTNAGISAAAMVPVLGQGATATKYVVRATREGVERVGREGIERGIKAAKEMSEAAGERGTKELAETVGKGGAKVPRRLLPGLKLEGRKGKLVKHAPDWGFGTKGKVPKGAADKVASIVRAIHRRATVIKQGTWGRGAGKVDDALFYSNGKHIVVTKPDGTFITILKNAMKNKHFQTATIIQTK